MLCLFLQGSFWSRLYGSSHETQSFVKRESLSKKLLLFADYVHWGGMRAEGKLADVCGRVKGS